MLLQVLMSPIAMVTYSSSGMSILSQAESASMFEVTFA